VLPARPPAYAPPPDLWHTLPAFPACLQEGGLEGLKLYGMVGVPGEGEEGGCCCRGRRRCWGAAFYTTFSLGGCWGGRMWRAEAANWWAGMHRTFREQSREHSPSTLPSTLPDAEPCLPCCLRCADVDATIALMQRLRKEAPKLRLTLGCSTFVPKAHTPFQWYGVSSGECLEAQPNAWRASGWVGRWANAAPSCPTRTVVWSQRRY